MNKTYHIDRTRGYPGARLDFNSTLREHIQGLLAEQSDLSDSVVQVKLSGDGARMTRSTNFMMFSFALLQQDVMSSKHNKTVAIINGKEDYETLKTALPDFFEQINSLIEKGIVYLLMRRRSSWTFSLGGDYKLLLMIMGLNAATADYACLWCEIHKQFRWVTSKDLLYYNEEPRKRTLDKVIKQCKCKSSNFGCIHPPLINIEFDHIVADELHLLLRCHR
ncbi:unnamed protein product [Paramuricea clavata]|uniref:Uncharacterized protein n=1 Tax=Paramuricea clavata TaxID=317549 RepID=A0A6S7KAX1_PARCT|nr:unnamed protein product [Paramuricea clavata]